jgi:hypothetical protein
LMRVRKVELRDYAPSFISALSFRVKVPEVQHSYPSQGKKIEILT